MKAETKKEFDALVKYVNTIDKCGGTLDTNVVKDHIRRIFKLEDNSVKGTFSLYDFVMDKKNVYKHYYNALTGVYHSNGYVFASDSHVIIKMKKEYPSEFEGKIIAKNGDVIDMNFPNCDNQIRKDGIDKMRIIDLNDSLLAKIEDAWKNAHAWAKMKGIKRKCYEGSFIVRLRGHWCSLVNLRKIVAAMKEMGLVSLYSDDRMIWAYNKETDEFVGMMKMIPHEYEEDIYFYADIY